MMSLALCVGLASAFVPPSTMLAPARPAVESSAVEMMARKSFRDGVTGYTQDVSKNIQTQRNGFGSFVQKFQTVSGKSKYGVPIFLPNGNVNPAYLAAERKEMQAQSKRNIIATE